MLIHGQWHRCPDGVVRPLMHSEILNASAGWVEVPFLLDTGADRTVLSNTIRRLTDRSGPAGSIFSGVGDETTSELIQTQIRFTVADGAKVKVHGEYAAFMQDESLDMSVLGRDITNLFSVIVDRPGEAVCLLGQRHRYRIEEVTA